MRFYFLTDKQKYVDVSCDYPRPMKHHTALKKLITAYGLTPTEATKYLAEVDRTNISNHRALFGHAANSQITYQGNNLFLIDGRLCNSGLTLNKLLKGKVRLEDALGLMRVLIDEHRQNK